MSKIPKVYVNPLEDNISNNRSFSYNKIEEYSFERNKEEVLKKINNIFNDSNKIYRVHVNVRFKDYDKDYILIGKTSNNLITVNDTLIKIDDIYDIKEK